MQGLTHLAAPPARGICKYSNKVHARHAARNEVQYAQSLLCHVTWPTASRARRRRRGTQVPHPLLAAPHSMDGSHPSLEVLEQAAVMLHRPQTPQEAACTSAAERTTGAEQRAHIATEALTASVWSPGAWQAAAEGLPPPAALLCRARRAPGQPDVPPDAEQSAASAQDACLTGKGAAPLSSHAAVEMLVLHQGNALPGELQDPAASTLLVMTSTAWAGVLLPQLVHCGAVPVGDAELRGMNASKLRLTFPHDFVETPAYWCVRRR